MLIKYFSFLWAEAGNSSLRINSMGMRIQKNTINNCLILVFVGIYFQGASSYDQSSPFFRYWKGMIIENLENLSSASASVLV